MEPLNRFPRMMQEYLVNRLDAAYEANTERVMALDSREDALAWREEVRAKIPLIFGEMPERCPVCDHRLLRGNYCSECGSKA